MRVNNTAETYQQRLERTALAPLSNTSNAYKLLVLGLSLVVAWGIYAFIVQYVFGLQATGMRDVVSWGFYITNFVFFIGISHAGTLISAILRVSHAGWRTPVTRMAELITVVAICVGAIMPMIDMGHVDRVPNLLIYGRFQSPLLWDIVAITCYLSGSLIYLYLPTIPDFALMRDRLTVDASAFKRKMYTLLAVGWQNTPEQKHRLEKALGIMAVTIIPIAVSVHTVVSFIFAMTLRPGWDSTAFGIYFVIGAIFSGIATLLIVMAIFRKVYHLEEYITVKHFKYLSYLMLVALIFYLYLTIGEYLTIGYKMTVMDKSLIEVLMLGPAAKWFWIFVVTGIVIPGFLLIYRRGPTMPKILTASVLINFAMWVKRFAIVVPTLQTPLMSYDIGTYNPTWVEISITAAAFAAFMLLFAIFAKLLPLLSIWEVAEDHEKVHETVPEPVAPVTGRAIPQRAEGRG